MSNVNNLRFTTLLKSSNGFSEVYMDTYFASKRIIFLEGDITNESACTFAKEMLNLELSNSKESIKLIINSPGGEIEAGMFILDVIHGCSAPVEMFCLGKASSMAALIFVSGKNGRYILENSKLMIHQPLVLNNTNKNLSEIKKIANDLENRKNQLFEILKDHSNLSLEILEEETKEDRYYSAQEAVQYNLADKIITFGEILSI